jgi:hypothetical protein
MRRASPSKAVPQNCDRCSKPLGSERVRVTRYEAGKVSGELHLCTDECLRAHYRMEIDDAVNKEIARRTGSEKNGIYKLVCPACKRRIRQLG